MGFIPCFVHECPKICNSLSELLKHFDDIHQMKSFHPVICKYKTCKRSFTNRRYYIQHFKKVHQRNFERQINIPEQQQGSTKPQITLPVTFNDLMESGSDSITENSPVHQVFLTSKIDNSAQNKSDPYNGPVEETLEEKFVDFCLKLHSSLTLPFSQAEEIVQSVMDLVGHLNCEYEESVLSLCNNKEEKVQSIMSGLEEKFDWVESTLKKYKSTYLLKKFFWEAGFFFPPVPKFIGFTRVIKRIKKKNVFRRINVKGTAVLIPLRKVLKVLFEQEGLLESVLNYMQTLDSEDEVISNFVQGECWKNTSEPDTGISLPLELYNDCLEVGNALGSHSNVNKMNATYFSIPCFRPEVKSSLDYMFLAFLTKSSNLKYFQLKTVFKSLIDELNFLSETGITINLRNQEIRLFFQFCALCADNLGLNTIGGFCQNFSKGKYNCRFCLADRKERIEMTIEDPILLRTEENYEEGVRLHDVSKTGIHELCAFNSVKDFTIVKNGLADVFHDIYEGVAVYDLTFLLKHYIFVTARFSISTYNKRLADFNFGVDISNKPPPLPLSFTEEKGKLRTSGCEMGCLIKNFGLLIGDLVPEGDPVWALYVALRKVVNLVFSPSFCKNSFELLKLYVHEHHLLYLNLTKRALTPKFHNLTHYPRLISRFGPLVKLATDKSERKHRHSKAVSRSVSSRRDICLTVSTKIQMKVARDFYKKVFTQKKFSRGPNLTYKNHAGFFAEVEHFIFTTPFPDILKDKNTIRTKWVEQQGTKYCTGHTLYLEIDVETSLPIFGLIEHIFITPDAEVYFLLKNFQTLGFSERFYAFRVVTVDSYSIYKKNQIHDFHPQNAASPAMLPDSSLLYVSLLHNA